MLRAAAFVAMALSAHLAGAAVAAKPGASATPSAISPVKAVHVRQEIHRLTAAQIAAFRKGVAVMQSRKADDPASWIYQANIHGVPSDSSTCPATPGPKRTAWSTCQHGSFFFLAWHRMYLYYLERMVRQASGDPSFTLPYWDYESPQHRDLPEPMRVPADSSNSLWVAQRAANCNVVKAGQPCVTAEDAADDEALKLIPFCNCPAGGSCAGCTAGLQPDEAFGGQLTPAPRHSGGNYGQLESQPHNVIHDAVGGSVGWMSFVECAARDPIFWLHHANIDRLWQVWLNQGGGHADPLSAGNWKNHLFTFFDVNPDGTTKKVTMSGCQVLNMATQLDYEYSGVPVQNVKLCNEPSLLATTPPAAAPRKLLAASQPAEIKLGNARTDVSVALPADAGKRIETLLAGPKTTRIRVVVEGLKLLHPGAVYRVYLNLPQGQAPEPGSPNFIGNVALFGEAGEHSSESSRSFDVTDKVAALRQRGQWSGQVHLSFFRGNPAGRAIGAGKEPLEFLRFTRVSVIER